MFGKTREAEARAEAEQLRSDLDDAHERLLMQKRELEIHRVRENAQKVRAQQKPVEPDPQADYQAAILRDFQTASKANTEAIKCLAHAQQVAAQAALALVEARKQVRRISEGVV